MDIDFVALYQYLQKKGKAWLRERVTLATKWVCVDF